MESKDLALKIAKILDSKKAIGLRVLKIGEISSIGDYFVIASANNFFVILFYSYLFPIWNK